MVRKKENPYKIMRWWKKHQFKILVVSSILFIIILYIINDKTTDGTWSLEYTYLPEHHQKKMRFTRESKGEKECRRVMEKIFMRAFPNKRPEFLLNTVTGKPLEIDCCNMELNLGVEYNGKQHYQYVKGMHKNYESFRIQQYRDEMKNRKCEEIGFKLITVPYKIPVESIENYLIEELRKLGYQV